MLPYSAELEAGLTDLGGRIALACAIAPSQPFDAGKAVAARAADIARGANPGQPDLHYLVSVLCTAGWAVDPARSLPFGWNRNDDVFAPEEAFLAKSSPEDKPVNHEHDSADIIGHITANVAVADGKEILSGTALDSLPPSFDLVTQSVLYLQYEDKKRQERTRRIVAEIAEGKWFVSMECLFSSFDYAVQTASGAFKRVPRQASTAFLTKHLRAYRGDGLWQGRRIGRLLKNIVFAGKGLVKDPANPGSVIVVGSAEPPANPLPPALPGYQESNAGNVPATERENEVELEKKLEAAIAESAEQKAKAAVLAADKGRLEASLAESGAALKAKAEEAATATAALKESQAKASALEADVKAAKAEIDSLKAEKRKAARTAKTMALLGLDEKAAAKYADDLEALADEKYEAHLAAVAALKPAPKTETETEKKPGKADASVLDGAKPEEKPIVPGGNAAGEGVRQAIAAYMAAQLGQKGGE